MLRNAGSLLALTLCLTYGGCAPPSGPETTEMPAAGDAAVARLLAPWQGPFGGVPDFSLMAQPTYLPALREALRIAMAETRAEIETIATNAAPATFANTIVALEASGARQGRARTYWRVSARNLATPEFRALQETMAPEFAAHSSAINGNARLFARVAAVRDGLEMTRLRPDQRRLVDLRYAQFARNGATLSGTGAERYGAIQARLAELHARFANNLLADEEGFVTFVATAELGGLPAGVVAAAKQAAIERGRPDHYAVTNTRSSMDPFLTYADNRALREQVWRNYYGRGDNNDAHDNNALIAEILQLRNERVRLLGYENFAQWQLENRMAQQPAAALGLLERLWPAATAKVRREVAAMQRIADQSADPAPIAPWDYRYYAELVRHARYSLDSNEVMQYLQLERLRAAMFFVAGKVFGFNFAALPSGQAPGAVPVFHPDVRVWEVTSKATGEHVGLWYLDPYARSGKASGAWAATYRVHATFAGAETVLCSNNSNFIKAPPGQPVLISWADAETLFHEFGHALHALASNVAYPKLHWGVRDYTEFHSQLLEHWLLTGPVVNTYLVHHATGEPMPTALIARLRAAATFNQGFATTEYLASALLDLKYHISDPAGLDARQFEREELAALNLPAELVMRHRSPQFHHVFKSESYAAGYYGYIWSEVLAADAAEAFEAAPGGFYDAALAASLVEHLFAPRNAVDPMTAYRRFRGSAPSVDALIRARGLLND